MLKGEHMSSDSIITPELRESVLSWQSEPMVFEMEKGAIKRYAEVIGDANPLWTDEARAGKSRYGGLVAMPIFLAYLNPFHHGVERPRAFPRSASAGNEFEFFHPVRPGDVITVTKKFTDLYEKKGGKGPLLFMVDEGTYVNQRGELVGRSRWTLVTWDAPPAPKEAGSRKFPEPPPRFYGYLGKRPPELRIEATAPLPRQVVFEEVEEGMELPPLVRTLSHDLFVRFAACNSEYGCQHVDYLYAAAVGWRDCIAQGLLGSSYLCKLMTDWMGEDGILLRLKDSYRGVGYPGDTWTCKGKVARKYRRDGENRIDCDIWIENQDGAIVTPGSATVAVPSGG